MDKITFGVMTDLHTDQIHNGRERLAAFVSDCRSRNADFMIKLGDFVKPHGCGTYLCPGFLNAKNTAEISAVLKKHADKVRLCIYGHKHQNLFGHWDGIPHYCVNSMSGYSLAPQYAAARFDAATEEQYPNLRYIAPYREPLYVIVTMDGGEIRIDGRTSAFLSPTPAELGVTFSDPSVVMSAEAGSVVM